MAASKKFDFERSKNFSKVIYYLRDFVAVVTMKTGKFAYCVFLI